MYKYLTKKFTYRYLDIISELLPSYKNAVHSTRRMTRSKVNPSNIYSVWQKINSLRVKIPQWRVKYKVVDLVTIRKEKLKFAKGYEQTFSTDIFRFFKASQRLLQPVYELSDFKCRPI